MSHILIVEDEVISQVRLQEELDGAGHTHVACKDAETAWQYLQTRKHRFDAILLDWLLPGRSGLDLLRQIKADPSLKFMPVILVTAMNSEDSMIEGIEAGAHYYLTKPYRRDLLLSVLGTALRDYGSQCKLRAERSAEDRCIEMTRQATFRFRSLEEVQQLAAHAARFYPDPGAVILGLSELMTNAVEHGNLGITYTEKTALLESQRWLEEIEARLARPPYADRHAELTVERLDDGIRYTLRDAGEGFNPGPYLSLSTERAAHTHGRGILIARSLCFEDLHYESPGNVVVLFKRF